MAKAHLYEVCMVERDAEKLRDVKTSLGFYTNRQKAEMDCNLLFMLTRRNPDIPDTTLFKVTEHQINSLTKEGAALYDDSFVDIFKEV